MSWIHLVDPEPDQLEAVFGKSIHPQALTNAMRVRYFRERIFSFLVEHDGYLFGELAFPAEDDVPFELEVIGLRVIADHERVITVLHAFVKKTQKTPRRELLIARERLRNVKRHA